jgi:hypothetical protein
VRLAPFGLVALVATGVVGCGGDDGGGVSDAQVARSACRALVSWTDDTAEVVNSTQHDMQEDVDLRPLMLAAIDAVIARTDALGEQLAELEFPSSGGGQAFARDLRDGQADAAADLEGFREEVLAIPDPDPESTNYRKAQLVVELEKPRSLVKPDVQDDLGDADLEAAIAAEESCRFVTRSQ